MWSIGLLCVSTLAALVVARSVPIKSAYPGSYTPKRLMYIQYSGNSRSAALHEGSAFAAGDKIAARTYFQGTRNGKLASNGEEGTGNDEELVSSLGEAYPEGPAEQPAEDELPQVYGAPPRRAPKANPAVEDDDEEEDDYEDEDEVSLVKVNRKAASGSGNKGSSNTYFPIHFGKPSGGAIAVSNSYSKGKGGTAVSRATAYGSPAGTKSRKKIAQN